MTRALMTFANDLLSTIAFVILFAITGNALLVTLLAVGIGIGQIAIEKWRGRPIDTMQWLSLGLVVVFGGASLATHDGRFIMVKPTLISFAVGAVMLRRGWLDRYLPERVHRMVPAAIIIASGYAWAALMFAVGIANLAVVFACSFQTWSWFISVVPLGAKLAAFGVQYLTFRMIIVRKLRGASPDAIALALAE